MANVNKALASIGAVIGTALLTAFGGLLGRLLEPLLKWTLFASMKLLIKILPPGKAEDTIKALYKEFKYAYKET